MTWCLVGVRQEEFGVLVASLRLLNLLDNGTETGTAACCCTPCSEELEMVEDAWNFLYVAC